LLYLYNEYQRFCLVFVNFLFIISFPARKGFRQEELSMQIGNKIRDLRIQKNLTQEELADRCELSKGFISQLERDLTSPSIATLIDILQCLGTDLKDFFDDSVEEQIAFQQQDYFEKIDDELKNKVEWIIPNAQKNMMEPIRLTLSPGGSTYPDNPHEGEEFGYILSGSIRLIIGKRIIRVKKGESFYFTANATHYLEANEKTGASLIWVSTPPSF
jgi:transcriptional regulator with XRE-family HTH domain